MKFLRYLFVTFAVATYSSSVSAQQTDDINHWLGQGALHRGVEYFERQLSIQDNNANLFSSGSVQFLAAIERLMQGFYRHGLQPSFARQLGIPFLRLPVANNPNPEPVTPAVVRELLQGFYDDMDSVNTVLQGLDDSPFKVNVALGTIGFDIDGDGVSSKEESLNTILRLYNRNIARTLKTDNTLTVAFDLADAHWLKGYSHLLMALLDTLLAYDWGRVYTHSAHLFFPHAQTPIAAFAANIKQSGSYDNIADAIAGLHVMNLPVQDSQRLGRARTHLKSMVRTSRKFWKIARAETDNDREWLPNSQQTAMTGTVLTEEMISGWIDFLDEAEQIIDGEKLIPHWRVKDGRGINLRLMFEQPGPFDPVLWVHGSGVLAYLEKGEMTSTRTWREFSRLFRGDFIGFAIWIN